MEIDRKVYTVKEVAAQLGISPESVYRAVLRGTIPSVWIGGRVLIPIEAFERLLEPIRAYQEKEKAFRAGDGQSGSI